MMKNLIRMGEYILFLLFLILIPFMKDKLGIFLGIPVVVLLFFLNKKIKGKNFPIWIFIISLAIRILTSIYLKVEIVDDFKTMLLASRDFINGNLNFMNTNYFSYFPYQIGHVLYQAFFLKIINSTLFLKIINSIITSLIVVLIYLISKKIVKEETARMITILYLLYFYPIYLNSVLTNQHLPALLSLIGIYLLMTKKHTNKLYILVAIILAFANIFRTESIILIGAILIDRLFFSKENKKEKITSSILLLGTYLILNLLISNIVYLTPLHTKLKNNYPEWKFYCGLSEKYNGIYNEEDQEVFFHTQNKKELVKNRIKEEKFKIPILILKKEVILWTQTNYDLRLKKNLNNFTLLWNQGYLNVMILLFVVSLIPLKKKNNNGLLIKTIILLYYGIYMFIEISPRYAYILHIFMFILIGIGIENLEKFYKKRKKEIV